VFEMGLTPAVAEVAPDAETSSVMCIITEADRRVTTLILSRIAAIGSETLRRFRDLFSWRVGNQQPQYPPKLAIR
jgi:hypothetical protein